jgi:ubiquinone/menaquinone biosynthesis C-methylase UbiE
MPDIAFRMMTWFTKVEDLFQHPADLLKKAPLKEGMTVVDYACGPGRYTIPVAKIIRPSGTVYAVDNQPLAIDIIKKKAAANSLSNVKPVLVDSFATGIPSSSADVVLLIDAISLISDRASLFKEIHRLLKPDGFLFMDSSHMSISLAKQIVEKTGLFTAVHLEGRTMLWAKTKNH